MHLCLILHSHSGGIDIFVLAGEEFYEKAGDPTVLAPDEERVPCSCLSHVGVMLTVYRLKSGLEVNMR